MDIIRGVWLSVNTTYVADVMDRVEFFMITVRQPVLPVAEMDWYKFILHAEYYW